MIESVFEGNFVSDVGSWGSGFNLDEGGGLAVYGEARISVRSSSFFRNGAENGGAMVIRGNNTVVVQDCLIEGNLANKYGGGVVLTVGCALCLFF